MKNVLISVATLIMATAAFAAAPPGVPSSSPSAAALATPSAPGAKVFFIEPTNGATVPTTFKVKFGLQGMTIAPAGSDEPNSGHHHLVIDLVKLPDMTKPLPANDHILHFGKGQTETELTLSAGETHIAAGVCELPAHPPQPARGVETYYDHGRVASGSGSVAATQRALSSTHPLESARTIC